MEECPPWHAGTKRQDEFLCIQAPYGGCSLPQLVNFFALLYHKMSPFVNRLSAMEQWEITGRKRLLLICVKALRRVPKGTVKHPPHETTGARKAECTII